MPAIFATAPAKAILLGEHAVVYGQPAIAIPLPQLQTKVTILASPIAPSGTIQILSPAIGLDAQITDLAEEHPIKKALSLLANHFNLSNLPAMKVLIHSDIPVAAGLGSGASVSVALIRAVSSFIGHPLHDEQVSAIAFEVEKIHHSTPSGIDNTVITFGRSLLFEHGKAMQFIDLKEAFDLIIADSGEKSSTRETVEMVRHDFQNAPHLYQDYFDNIGILVKQALFALQIGSMNTLGSLLTENQLILNKMKLSTPKLDDLIGAAMQSGALGAKLTGGGGGGCIIALVDSINSSKVRDALTEAGALGVFSVTIKNQNGIN